MTKYQQDLHSRFKKKFILESTKFILKNNKLTFDSELYLQIKSVAKGTIFATTLRDLLMGYQIYCVIRQIYTLASNYFENLWFRFLGDCRILLKVNLIKPDHLLSILNQIINNIQFTAEKTQTRLPFLDIMITKISTTNCMDIYNKPTDSK